jgi:hypothetical protein
MASLYRTDTCGNAEPGLLRAHEELYELLTPPRTIKVWKEPSIPLRTEHDELAREFLRPWLKSGVTKQDIDSSTGRSSGMPGRRVSSCTDPRDARLPDLCKRLGSYAGGPYRYNWMLVQYVGGVLYVAPGNGSAADSWLLINRRRQAAHVVREAVRRNVSIGDFEVWINPGDGAHPGVNLGLVHEDGMGTLPISMLEAGSRFGSYDWYSRSLASLAEAKSKHPWASRTPKAVFRGSPHADWRYGCFPYGGDERAVANKSLEPLLASGRVLCGRSAIQRAARSSASCDFRHLFDVQGAPLSMEQQERFKLTVYAEGNMGWANRLRTQLGAGYATVLQLNRGAQEWYSHPALGLRPWVHYLPVDHLFTSLPAVVEWALAHDAATQRIVQNANRWAARYLSVDSMHVHAESLLYLLAALQQKARVRPITLHPQAASFDAYVAAKEVLDSNAPQYSQWWHTGDPVPSAFV